MHLEIGQPVRDASPAPGQKAGTQAIGGAAKPQVQAGRLDLFGRDGGIGADDALVDQIADIAVGQNAIHVASP